MKIRMVAFNRAKALEYLKLNSHNRPIRTSKVLQMALEMKSGRWRSDIPDPIMRDEHGVILNGQHRLWAIVYAETVTITLPVIDCVDPTIQGYIDCGATRSLVDRASLTGLLPPTTTIAARLYAASVKYFCIMPSIELACCIGWTADIFKTALSLSQTHIDFAIETLQDLEQPIRGTLHRAGIIVAIARAHACKVTDATLIAFVDILTSGQHSKLKHVTANKYVSTTRDWILQKKWLQPGGTGRTDARNLYSLVARAIHCFDNDLTMIRVSLNTQDIYPRAKRLVEWLQSITPKQTNGPTFNAQNKELLAGE